MSRRLSVQSTSKAAQWLAELLLCECDFGVPICKTELNIIIIYGKQQCNTVCVYVALKLFVCILKYKKGHPM